MKNCCSSVMFDFSICDDADEDADADADADTAVAAGPAARNAS